jgi:hypothetical protein
VIDIIVIVAVAFLVGVGNTLGRWAAEELGSQLRVWLLVPA